MFESILKEIQDYDTIILHRHSKPDGDAIGSQVGLKHLLVENFPSKRIYMVGDDADTYGFMDDSTLDEIPDSVIGYFQEELVDNDEYNKLLVSLGFFTVVRIERPAQYLINAVEYCVPEKECTMPMPEDPCSLFRNMAFPVNEFCPPSVLPGNNGDGDAKGKCGCGN